MWEKSHREYIYGCGKDKFTENITSTGTM